MESKSQGSAELLDTVAFLVSVVTSPYLVCAAFTIWILSCYATSFLQFVGLAGSFLSLAVAFPLGFVLLGIWQGKYTDIHVAIRSQREEVFTVATCSVGVLSLLYYLEGVSLPIVALAVSLFVNGMVFWIISMRWKISVHTAALTQGAIAGALLVTPWALLWLLAIPAVAWARLRRNRHTLIQVIAGVVAVGVLTPAVFWGLGAL